MILDSSSQHTSPQQQPSSSPSSFTTTTTPHPPQLLEIGLGLTTFGVVFLVLGVLLLFDRPMLTLGNMLFVAGTIVLIGPDKCFKYFTNPSKFRGTICFIVGMVMVVFKWPIIGMLLELFGIANLFGNFFPTIVSFLRKLPGIGPCLEHKWVQPVVDRLSGESSYLIGGE